MKHKFKVGDIVRTRSDVKLPVHYYVTNENMVEGEVVWYHDEPGIFEVRVLKHKLYPTLEGYTYDVDDKFFELIKPESIVIYRKGNEVYALDKQTGKKVVAKCHPDDEFDFNKGAEIAFNRLIGKEPEKDKEEFYNGKVVCVKNTPKNKLIYTVGKIYEVIDGKLTCDDGTTIPMTKGFSSFDEFKKFSYSDWLEVVE